MKLLVNGGVLLASLALCGVLGEAVLRAAPRPLDADQRDDGRVKHRFNPFRPDGVLAYALRPDWESVHQTDEFQVRVRTNALSLRGEAVAPVPRPGTTRVLVVGDSFAFGWGVEDAEAFPARLSAALGPDVEVLNAGVPGWSADQYYLYLLHHGFALAPDLLLLAPHDNDLKDLAWNHLTLDERGLPLRVESTLRMIDETGRMRYVNEGSVAPPVLSFPGKTWLADHSALYHWLRFRLAKLWVATLLRSESASREEAAGDAPEGEIASLGAAEILRGIQTGKPFQLRYHRYLMDAIEDEAADRDIQVRTLLVAARNHVPDPDDAETWLHDACRARAACFDTAGLFSPQEREDAFYRKDRHWTPLGHARAATALARWLQGDAELGFAPGPDVRGSGDSPTR